MDSGGEKSRLAAAPVLCLAYFLLAVVPARGADENFAWEQKGANDEKLKGTAVASGLIPEITFTQIPKPTADVSRYTREYEMDLKRFGISNECENPVETSRGINAALQYARTAGKNRIIFPAGTYLISEKDPVVLDHTDTIVDLNGATLQINTNGLRKYAVVKIVDGARNLRLTNGTIRGDKDTHDYTAGGEWGTALSVRSGRDLEIDHLTLTNAMGDGVGTSANIGSPGQYRRVKLTNMERGGFTERGAGVASDEKTRTIEPYDLSIFAGEFEFGWSEGYQGRPYVKDADYQAYFYDANKGFVGMRRCLQFRKVPIPRGARWMHLEFNQPDVTGTRGYCGRITNLAPPRDVHFHHNHCLANRRLGMAFCGGLQWIIEDNVFEKNGGTSPAYGVDLEDGWDLMQDVVIRNNTFKENVFGDLVICAGTELLIEGNEFQKYNAIKSRAHNWVWRKNKVVLAEKNAGLFAGYTTSSGVASIRDNYYGPRSEIRFKNTRSDAPLLKIEDSVFDGLLRIRGDKVRFFNCRLKDVNFSTYFITDLIHLKNCELDNVSINYLAGKPTINVIVENCRGKVREYGPGIKNKVTRRYERQDVEIRGASGVDEKADAGKTAQRRRKERPVDAVVRLTPKPGAMDIMDDQLRARLAEALAAGGEVRMFMSSLRQTVRVTAIDDAAVLKMAGRGGLNMSIAWPRLTSADKRVLAASLCRDGNEADAFRAAFYAMAAHDKRGADQYLRACPGRTADIEALFASAN